MDHVAIMERTGVVLEKVLAGEKTIETRWTKTNKTPYEKIRPGDVIYFRNTMKPITAKATVQKTLFFSPLNQTIIQGILKKYGKAACMSMEQDYESIKETNYCTLIFLEGVESTTPFHVDKTGFGSGAAWMTLPDITAIKKAEHIPRHYALKRTA